MPEPFELYESPADAAVNYGLGETVPLILQGGGAYNEPVRLPAGSTVAGEGTKPKLNLALLAAMVVGAWFLSGGRGRGSRTF